LADGIRNSRQSLRVRLRAEALIVDCGVSHRCEVVDVGARGCRVVSPQQRWPAGTELGLRLLSPLVGRPLDLVARVVWATELDPWSHGLSFSEEWHPEGERWFDALTSANPELLIHDRVPDLISLDTRLGVDPGWRHQPEAASHELAVLHHAHRGATARQLRAHLAGDWSDAKRALFSLVDRGALTLQPGRQAGPVALDGEPFQAEPRRKG